MTPSSLGLIAHKDENRGQARYPCTCKKRAQKAGLKFKSQGGGNKHQIILEREELKKEEVGWSRSQ